MSALENEQFDKAGWSRLSGTSKKLRLISLLIWHQRHYYWHLSKPNGDFELKNFFKLTWKVISSSEKIRPSRTHFRSKRMESIPEPPIPDQSQTRFIKKLPACFTKFRHYFQSVLLLMPIKWCFIVSEIFQIKFKISFRTQQPIHTIYTFLPFAKLKYT